ncbi:MAG TPA: hypothetical protein VLK25_01240 [Allosphingosinicella sp.]|nr:hypothetical protein [Allosphingosinicella sp.]
MSPGKLAAGALMSLLLSLVAYFALAGFWSWLYFTGTLSAPGVEFSPSRFAWLTRLLLALAYFVPIIFLWWLVTFLAELKRGASSHGRFAPADCWLLLAAIVWSLLQYAAVTRRVPVEYYECGGSFPGFAALCAHPNQTIYWGVTAIAASFVLIGLLQRVKGVRRG